MLEGIYLWDAKHGLPANLNDSDSVETFINELREKPQEANANLHGFAQFFSEFLQEATVYYPEDEGINQNKDIAGVGADDVQDVILFLSNMPEASSEYYMSVLEHGANLFNLIHWDPISQMVSLPTDPKNTEHHLSQWQQQLVTLKQPPAEEQEALPDNKTKIKRLAVKLLKEHLKELGVKNAKVKSGEAIRVSIQLDKVKVDLRNLIEIDIMAKIEKGKIRVFNEPDIYIYIEGAISISICYFQFIKMPYKRGFLSHEYFASNTVAELKKNLAESLKMLMYLYPHMKSNQSFYHFLSNAKNDKHLSRHYFYSLRHIDQRVIYQLACLTTQPDLTSLYDRYKQEYIDDNLFKHEEAKKHFNLWQEERERNEEGHIKKPYSRKPENPEAEYAKEFDDYVAQIAQF